MNNLTKYFLYCTFIILLGACTSTANKNAKEQSLSSKNYIVLNYSDFGPSENDSPLGVRYWQWPDPQNHQPVSYDIKVVVYRDLPLEQVEKLFPVIKEKRQDYRYITHQEARKYLNSRLIEMTGYLNKPSRIVGDDENNDFVFHEIMADILETLIKIERQIGKG
ncbi:hypothetical protein [Aliikangiella maris]|uniref:Uncharacterized protein n=2 Tax=Aliikangiella maris TaxID=3162458 RepID=A0ABV3MJK8_9GAMM